MAATEEPIVAAPVEQEVASVPAVEEAPVETTPAAEEVAGKAKKVKETKPKKAVTGPKKARKASTHPTYYEVR